MQLMATCRLPGRAIAGCINDHGEMTPTYSTQQRWCSIDAGAINRTGINQDRLITLQYG